MNRLVTLIGKAPHEMPFGDLCQKLRTERMRISRILSIPKQVRKAKKAKTKSAPRPKKTISEAQLLAIAEATGVPIEDLRRGGR